MNAQQSPQANPFPGLRPFEKEENHLFFGRDGQSDELLSRLRKNRFLAVVGTSGSGKSSLVRAGLLPGLEGGMMLKAGTHWRTAIFRPGNHPIANLAKALNEADVYSKNGGETVTHQIFTETALRRGAVGLIEAVTDARLPQNEKLLLVVDQFEELFRFKSGTDSIKGYDEAAAFVKLLLEASWQETLPIYVVLTMRSDYIGDCAQFRDLPEAINDGQYLIPRMTREQRRQAISGPIKVGGGEISARLTNRVLNEVGDNPDQLPILQHALMRTWDFWESARKNGEPIDIEHYESIGGLQRALSKHADEAFKELRGKRNKQITEKLFKALTEKESENREIRRPATLAQICEIAEAEEDEVLAIVETFRKPGRAFLMPPVRESISTHTLIDISHESLIRNWLRLKKWVDEEGESARTYKRLAETAVLYKEDRAGLWRNPDLEMALAWREKAHPNAVWAARYSPHFEIATSFLEESQLAHQLELAAIEEARQHELAQAKALAEEQSLRAEAEKKRAQEQEQSARRLKRGAIVLLVVMVIAVVAAIFALQLKQTADEERQNAVDNFELAKENERQANLARQVADSAKIVALEERRIADERRLEAERQRNRALQQERIANANLERAETAEEDALNQARLAKDNAEAARQSQIAAERQAQIADSLRKIYLVRSLASVAPLQQQIGQDERGALLALQAYHFNESQAEASQTPEVYEGLRRSLNAPFFSEGAELGLGGPRLKRKHDDWARTVAYHPNGGFIASGSGDGRIYLWDLQQDSVYTMSGHAGSVRAITFSAGGDSLFSGSDDGTIRLWSNMFRGRAASRTLTGHKERVWAIDLSPDNRILASGAADGEILIWQLSRSTNSPKSALPSKAPIRALTFADNGETLLSAGRDGEVTVWAKNSAGDFDKSHEFQVSDQINAIVLSPDGNELALGLQQGAVSVLNWKDQNQSPRQLYRHDGGVTSLAYSPDGITLASGGYDKTVRLTPLNAALTRPLILQAHEDWVLSIAFSPAGDRIASGGADRAIGLWYTNPDNLAELVCQKVQRSLSQEEWAQFIGNDLKYEESCGRPSSKQ